MSKGRIPLPIIKALYARSGGLCAMCREKVIEDKEDGIPIIIGEIIHIEGVEKGSARYNPQMTDEERNSYNNLIILCRNCHIKVDRNPEFYTVRKLRQIKYEHERWVREQLGNIIPEVTFEELEIIIKYLKKPPLVQYPQDLKVVPTKEKIRKNMLSEEVANLITMGMSGYYQVQNFINKYPEPEFSEKLRNMFVQKYLELKDKGLKGDDLFYELWDFASPSYLDFKTRAAGLKILTYFFEICEVFEK